MMKKMLSLFAALMLLCGCACAETDEKGAFRVDTFQGGAMGITFIDITVDENADMISLWTNCTVTNARLEKLTWNDSNIVETTVLFSADTLASNQVLNIAVDTPDVLPVLRVSAVNEQGQNECWYITRSGENGAPILISPDAFGIEPFSAIAGLPFSFCSGVGAWETLVTFAPDGSFTGRFHDSDMGDSGKDYPGGTCYICNFEGKVSAIGQTDSQTWKLRLDTLTCTDIETEPFIRDGIKYIPSAPYGLEKADTLWLYLPGTPLSTLSEEFLSWAQLWSLDGTLPAVLGCCGLYNEVEEYGFVTLSPEIPYAE